MRIIMNYPKATIHPNKFQLTEPWGYRGYVIHEGFWTDLASVPKPFNGIIPSQGKYAYSAILHDYLYTWP